MRILNVEPARYDDETRERLSGLGGVDYVECASQEEFEAVLESQPYEVLILRLGLAVTERVLRRTASLRVVATPTTGLDHIDLDACAARSIRVLSLRGEVEFLRSIRSTAEHTWALLLALCRHIPRAHADVLAGNWRREPFLAEELEGTTLGILGLGRLGGMVAQYGVAFGMRVVATDPRPSAFTESPVDVEPLPLDRLLAVADVLSLHIPLNDSTRGLIGSRELGRLRSTAVLVNTSRGEVLDERALVDALREGRLAGVALDVLAGDAGWPAHVPGRQSLVELARQNDRIILTPHIGGFGHRSVRRARSFIAAKVCDALANPGRE